MRLPYKNKKLGLSTPVLGEHSSTNDKLYYAFLTLKKKTHTKIMLSTVDRLHQKYKELRITLYWQKKGVKIKDL